MEYKYILFSDSFDIEWHSLDVQLANRFCRKGIRVNVRGVLGFQHYVTGSDR